MDSERDLTDRLRDRIVSAIHLGQLRAGDRLPSIRDTSRDFGVDHRVVTQAYRALQGERLVEIRTRSGIYVAQQERVGEGMLSETVDWMAGVLRGAVQRRIAVPDFAALVRRCTTSARVRCACVESVRDQMVAYRTELEQDLGIETAEVLLPPGAAAETDVAVVRRLRDVLHDVDVAVTTRYHAGVVGQVAGALGKPTVMVTIHPDLIAAVRRRLRQGRLTVVALDPAFGERLRSMYSDLAESSERIRVVLVEDADAMRALDPAEPVLLTRAARQHLGPVELPLLFPHSPTLSPETVQRLCEAMIRLNLQAAST